MSVTVPPGHSQFELAVTDQAGNISTAIVGVDVGVGGGPVLSQVGLQPACVWPPLSEYVLFRLGQEIQVTAWDPCDPAPAVWVDKIVPLPNDPTGWINPPPEAVHGEDAFCVKASPDIPGSDQKYAVTIRSANFLGKTSEQTVQLTIGNPIEFLGECSPVPLDRVVSKHDARCTASGKQKVIP